MPTIIGVQFQKAGKIYYFDPLDNQVRQDQYVIVETARGIEYARVALENHWVPDEEVVAPLKSVIRIANEEDATTYEENLVLSQEAYQICTEKIIQCNLEMKLVNVEYTFDRAKIIFNFTADERVDFRELIKELASVFHTRIELRQIGVRDEAKIVGGIGICGQPLCCHRFLGDFSPVSIKMAKEQSLSLNPTKISGCCGRLLCCLTYENEHYVESNRLAKEASKAACACGGNCPCKQVPDSPEGETGVTLEEEIEILEEVLEPIQEKPEKKEHRPKGDKAHRGDKAPKAERLAKADKPRRNPRPSKQALNTEVTIEEYCEDGAFLDEEPRKQRPNKPRKQRPRGNKRPNGKRRPKPTAE